jgi:hypothetical protein
MSEFMHQRKPPQYSKKGTGDGFDQMGKPIPIYRRTAALHHCHAMGLTDPEQAWACVGAVAEQLERDEPYEAMKAGMRWLDLTGTYRLFAALLAARDPDAEPRKKKR